MVQVFLFVFTLLVAGSCRSRPPDMEVPDGLQPSSADASRDSLHSGDSSSLPNLLPPTLDDLDAEAVTQSGECAYFEALAQPYTNFCEGTGRIGCVEPDGSCGGNWKASGRNTGWGEEPMPYGGALPRCFLNPTDPGFDVEATVLSIRTTPRSGTLITNIDVDITTGVPEPCGTSIRVYDENLSTPNFKPGDRFRYARRNSGSSGSTVVRDLSGRILFLQTVSVPTSVADEKYARDVAIQRGGHVCTGEERFRYARAAVTYLGSTCVSEARSYRCCTFDGAGYALLNHSTIDISTPGSRESEPGASVNLIQDGFFVRP